MVRTLRVEAQREVGGDGIAGALALSGQRRQDAVRQRRVRLLFRRTNPPSASEAN